MNKENIATARYNMSFDNGSFIKGKNYKYKYIDNKIYVITEESREQDFFFSEFDALFYFDNNCGGGQVTDGYTPAKPHER